MSKSCASTDRSVVPVSTADIRKRFLTYFGINEHQVVPSSSLLPANDKSLMFVNAGMFQFKDTFLGTETRPYVRAASSQKCVRAGGKHNDLENVGYTARHHTFFEMLGNFSFGDYFKREAINYAWEFLTEELKLPKEKLWVTVYLDDDEAADIWINEIGVPKDRLSRLGKKDNYWSMGDTGPCGPCSEIFYDHGPDVPGGPPGSPDDDLDRYIEIWNLVFMQFNSFADGRLEPLPKPSVDTGMGLERIAAVMQGVHSNYEIDLFQSLIKAAAKATNTSDLEHKSLRVIADHIRACAFLITDGVLPSNEGSGYVLRRIARRAIRQGYKLGQNKPFFYSLVATLVEQMGEAYPDLKNSQAHVEKVLLQEEERFAQTLDQGMGILNKSIAEMKGNVIDGEIAFKLYDTYGFPYDLTADIAREQNLTVDNAGFEKAMEAQRTRARAASNFATDYNASVDLNIKTQFIGYDRLVSSGEIKAILVNNELVKSIDASETNNAILVLDNTSFYAEGGGQVGDIGQIEVGDNLFIVTDTKKQGDAFLHFGSLEKGALNVGDKVETKVEAQARNATIRNHSATHLMHAALRNILGDHVQQKGSLVEPSRLRFDFSHYEAVTEEQLSEIEAAVNEQIQLNLDAESKLMSFDDAIASGALAFFDEKYGDKVRVLKFGDYSTELCGGTHVNRVGDIGFFKITSESGIAAGVRRIEAVTGQGALQWAHETDALLNEFSKQLRTGKNNLSEKLVQTLEKQKLLDKEIKQLKAQLAGAQSSDMLSEAIDVSGVKVLAQKVSETDPNALRDTVDQIKNKLGQAVVLLIAETEDGKVRLAAGVTKAESKKLKAGALVNIAAQAVGGKGGGRPDMAMAGGTQPENIDAALALVLPWVKEQLGV